MQPGAGTHVPPVALCTGDTMHSHGVRAGRQLVVKVSSVASLDVCLEKSNRVIPVCCRAGGAAGFASVWVRARQRAGLVQSLDATGSVASSHGLLQEWCLLLPGQPGLLGASAASVLHFQSKRGCYTLRLSLSMPQSMPWFVLAWVPVSLITTSVFATGLTPTPLLQRRG